MKQAFAVLVAVAALVGASSAIAGGWATVGLTPLPDGMRAGEEWVATLKVLQHGRTPLSDVQPKVILRGESGRRLSYPAKFTGTPGVYRARITLPAGRWQVAAYDGFTLYGGARTHTFGTADFGSPAGGGFPVWPVVGGAIAVALLAAAAAAVRVRRTREAVLPAG